MKILAILLTLLISQFSFAARTWEKVMIPGAVCGNGEPYFVYVDLKATENVAFSFMGGGACWDKQSCYGLVNMTRLDPMKKPPGNDGIMSDNPFINPISDWTMVFVPYCTGDVHLANHVAEYKKGVKTYHYGFTNFQKVLRHLTNTSVLDFTSIKNFAMYGYSAGAIGAMLHASNVEKYLSTYTHKILIIDSPGLHFGKNFWKKFSSTLVADYAVAISMIGGKLNPNEGNMSPIVPIFCQRYADWDIGFLQSDKDLVMSSIFGDITPIEHQMLIRGKGGLLDATKYPDDHCSSWVPSSMGHTFLASNSTVNQKAGPKSAIQYLFDLVKGKRIPNSQ